ncbi:MAG: hypothetical protein KUG77_08190 [Nannocystaceae bacterium]|nr:hypothetical protein [Nannocystaceae bacterium]
MTDDRIPDELAAAALERAAQLQLDAAERVERSATAVARRDGYARAELLDAAAEAGIEPRFLELALREQALSKGDTSTDSDAALLRWLGTRQRSLSVSRVFDEDLKTMVASCCRVLESDKVGLQLRGEAERMRSGLGVVLEFHMPRFNELAALTGSYSQLAYRLEQLEMWTLHVSFRPLGERTEVAIVGDLRPGAHGNLKFARFGGVLGGGFGAAGGVAAGLAIVSAATALPAVVLGVALAATGTGAMAVAYRGVYRRVLSKTEAEFENVLALVAGDLSRKALLGE